MEVAPQRVLDPPKPVKDSRRGDGKENQQVGADIGPDIQQYLTNLIICRRYPKSIRNMRSFFYMRIRFSNLKEPDFLPILSKGRPMI